MQGCIEAVQGAECGVQLLSAKIFSAVQGANFQKNCRLTSRYSPFATCRSPFASHHSLFANRHSLPFLVRQEPRLPISFRPASLAPRPVPFLSRVPCPMSLSKSALKFLCHHLWTKVSSMTCSCFTVNLNAQRSTRNHAGGGQSKMSNNSSRNSLNRLLRL